MQLHEPNDGARRARHSTRPHDHRLQTALPATGLAGSCVSRRRPGEPDRAVARVEEQNRVRDQTRCRQWPLAALMARTRARESRMSVKIARHAARPVHGIRAHREPFAIAVIDVCRFENGKLSNTGKCPTDLRCCISSVCYRALRSRNECDALLYAANGGPMSSIPYARHSEPTDTKAVMFTSGRRRPCARGLHSEADRSETDRRVSRCGIVPRNANVVLTLPWRRS